jgi:hypothetical protein
MLCLLISLQSVLNHSVNNYNTVIFVLEKAGLKTGTEPDPET